MFRSGEIGTWPGIIVVTIFSKSKAGSQAVTFEMQLVSGYLGYVIMRGKPRGLWEKEEHRAVRWIRGRE